MTRLSLSLRVCRLSTCLSVSLPVCLSNCLSVSLPVCGSVSLPVCVSPCLSLYLTVCVSAFLQVRVENMSKEKDMLRQAESRLCQEKEVMLSEQRSQNLLLNNLKSIQVT